MNCPDHARSGVVTNTSTRTLLAALSGSPETGAVLNAAIGMARLLGSEVEAVHVAEEARGTEGHVRATRAAGVVLRERKGLIADQLLEALEPPGVLGVVMGLRAFISGPRPAGSIALGVLRAAAKPILFVPPEAYFPSAFEPRRLLVPLDGTHETSSAFLEFESALQSDADREVTVVHTLDGYGAPLMERPEHDLPAWANSFVRQHCPGEHRSFEWRTGNPADAVINVAEKAGSDLIVLSFGGDIEVGHGAVIREVLARSPMPVLVLPVSRSASSGNAGTEESNLRVNHQMHSVEAG
jgi:nucleotide-binding universal stress UspA family protein